MTNLELRSWYRYYNRLYFDGELPRCVVQFKKMRGDLGHTFWGDDRIYINEELKAWDRIARTTLLHEMVHVYLPKEVNHGHRFQREMLRLAKAGAFKGLW